MRELNINGIMDTASSCGNERRINGRFAERGFLHFPLCLRRKMDKKTKKTKFVIGFLILLLILCAVIYIENIRYCKNRIIGNWTNGSESWASRYEVTFYTDGTVERHGYRNHEKGTYEVRWNKIIVDYNDCTYDYMGYIPIEGYTMHYQYNRQTDTLTRLDQRDFVYVSSLGADNRFDNDDYTVPLQRADHN